MKRIQYLSAIAVFASFFAGCDDENVIKDTNGVNKDPKVETVSAEKGSLHEVSITGIIISPESLAPDYECGVEYSTDATFPSNNTSRQKAEINNASGNFTVTIIGVTSSQKYYYRAYCINQLTYYYGEIKDFSFTWEITQSGTENNYAYVDLGLSVKWATMNVGSTKPEDYGDYYAWGETMTKSTYDWSTYKYYDGSESKLTKYVINDSYGAPDYKTILLPEDDVAHDKWGGNWRMPTIREFKELLDSCAWEWTAVNSVNGYKVTSRISGYEDNTIFLPATGYRLDSDLDQVGFYGSYWSSSIILGGTGSAWYLNFYSNYHSMSGSSRFGGRCIRPVCPSEKWMEGFSLRLNKESDEILLGRSVKLTVEIIKNDDVNDYYSEIIWSSDNPTVASVDINGLVVGVSKGEANITVTWRNLTTTCKITVIEESEVPHEYVDLGLSVNWATLNVGAANKEEYGHFFAWGETEPKSTYDWSSYKYCQGSSYSLTKYNTNSNYGLVDGITTLELEDDVAHIKWGGGWRMPTKDEFYELRNNCTWEWTTINGAPGYKVTSNITGYEDRSIFLQAVGNNCNYWSSSLSGWTEAYCFYLSPSNYYSSNYNYRYLGHFVRPVCQSDKWLDGVSLHINKESDEMIVGNSTNLSASIYKNGNAIYAIGSNFIWSSDNPSVATVDDNGLVVGVSKGEANITVTWRNLTTTCKITVIEESEVPHEYVDLGLSVKWATLNVGAANQKQYGLFFAWGETEPKSTYDWSSYKYCQGSSYSLTKYNTNSNYGLVDGITTLELEDDVAHIKWGGGWRMPTKDEFYELRNNCTWEWTTINGASGYKVTSNITGYEDRSIFLQAVGNYCNYWSSSLSGQTDAYCLYLYPTNNYRYDHEERWVGRCVRPVCQSDTWLDGVSLHINKESDGMIVGNSTNLSASIYKNGNAIYAIGSNFIWSSDNPFVATVDDNGLVVGVSKGEANITVTWRNLTTTCKITVIEESEVPHEYVDLGLSVNWATFNVGAANKEEYGHFFAWGETEPKSTYDWSSYKYCQGSSYSLTKYNTNSNYGLVDGITTLELEDDVAHMKWGGNWRMPTEVEFEELRNNCTWEWINMNGISGYKITSNKIGYEDKSIFLPAAGYRVGTSHNDNGICGCYWFSPLYVNNPHMAGAFYYNNTTYSINNYYRYEGLSVRPVCKSDSWLEAASFCIDKEHDVIIVDALTDLSAMINNIPNDFGTQVLWSSDDPSVATVDNKGHVKGITPGSAVITASWCNLTAKCDITVLLESEYEHTYVDLGLSVRWATVNVGAIKPEEYGNYFAWGETKPKDIYNWSSYKYCQGSYQSLTKYNTHSSNGLVDSITTLEFGDDVAHIIWGGDWRMPTEAEFTELRNNCTWEWTIVNGIYGYKIKSRVSGFEDNSIFLPAAGALNTDPFNVGTSGYYWTCNLVTYSYLAGYLYFNSNFLYTRGIDRSIGQSVRPVCP